ncbi:MAG: histidine phosphatase family protein [Alphaproteobacteria bacterium]|nr:histidine phosphatase family protein [Alphaproteobacteria bacterium]
MRRLMLLRHAKTETDAPSGNDRDRRLDERGQRDSVMLGEWIATHPPFPEIVLVSPAQRARQTWEIAWDTMMDRCPLPLVENRPELYGADPAHLLQAIRSVPGPRQLLLIGHNPGMHELALMLVDGRMNDIGRDLAINLPTAGLAIFDFDVSDWAAVSYRSGRLARFVSPRLLREEC